MTQRSRRSRSRGHDRVRRHETEEQLERRSGPGGEYQNTSARLERVDRREKDGEVGDSGESDWLARKRKEVDPLTTKAGGAYIPPAKLKMMQQKIEDKGSEQYQRLEWERLKKKIHGHVNKISVSNLVTVVRELLQENIVRGKGLLARSIIQAQAFSPTFSHVYAALVSVINSKFPHIGELVLRRLIVQFKRSFRRNDKQTAVTVTKFLAHLINQQVTHEVLALEILTLLLETPTDDSVEVAVAFLRESGAKLTEVTPRGINAIFDRLRSILQESKDVDKRVQYMIEVIFSVRKDKFSAHPSVIEELDLVEEDDQITHTITLEDAQDPENILNVFRFDSDFEKSEEMYGEIRREILGENSDVEEDEEASEESDEEENEKKTAILDNTETNLVAFRRLVYLTIQSSLDYQEAAHKLMKIEIKPGFEVELCNMVLDCCAQQRTYEKFYGLMAERFARLRKDFQQHFEQIFKDTYETIHRFEIMKLRNTAKLFAHLLFTDAISWEVLSVIKLNEDDSSSSGRIFIKMLFQELAEFMGLEKLYERIRDGVDLREHLQSGPKQIVSLPDMPVGSEIKQEDVSSESSSSDSPSASSSSSSTESDDSEPRRREKQRKKRRERDRKAKASRSDKSPDPREKRRSPDPDSREKRRSDRRSDERREKRR